MMQDFKDGLINRELPLCTLLTCYFSGQTTKVQVLRPLDLSNAGCLVHIFLLALPPTPS